MASPLLGEDGRGYELARKLESEGVWRTWLGDPLYSTFVHSLSSPSSWDSFINPVPSKSTAQIHLQLRARALLFDKASCAAAASVPFSTVGSPSSSSTALISRLNPNYLQLHGDDVYFTFEGCSQDGSQHGVAASNKTLASKLPTKAATGVAFRYNEKEMDTVSQRSRQEEFPECWYIQFFEKYKSAYRLSLGDQEMDQRTPEQMSTYLRVLEKHKRRRVIFTENITTSLGNSCQENGSMRNPNFVSNDNDDETYLFPETMFPFNCVPDSVVPPKNRVKENLKINFNGVLDTLPQIVKKSPIMIERLGIRPEYLGMGYGGNNLGKDGTEGNSKLPNQEQASDMSRKVIARMLAKVGLEASAEVPMQVLSQLLSCHVCKLGRILRTLADNYRKDCSAIELLKMFLQTAGHSNLRAFEEIVKDSSRNAVQPSQQQIQIMNSQMQLQQQGPLRQPQQIPGLLHPHLQQMFQSHNLTPQQQQQLVERLRRRQHLTARPGMNTNVNSMRPLLEVKLEAPSESPIDNINPYGAINARHPQLQDFRQQQLAAAIPNFQPQSPSMSSVRVQPVKVEGFQELMGGDSSLKHDSEENKLMSPSK